MNGNRNVALTLLVCGAEVNIQDKDGKTALMVAIINGHQDLVELLLQKNADITVKNLVNIYIFYFYNFEIVTICYFIKYMINSVFLKIKKIGYKK